MNKLKNPVMIGGLKTRMRSMRSFILISIALLLLLGVLLMIYYSYSWNFKQTGYYTAQIRIQIGERLYESVAGLLFGMTVLIVPGMTSGLIAGERERQTLDLLLCTPLSGFAIIWGKLFSTLAYFILILVASFPFIAIVFLFGGIEIISLLQLLGYIIICAIACGCVGMFYSSFCKRTTLATILTYLTIFGFGIATIVVGLMHTNAVQQSLATNNVMNSYEYISPILMTNPALGLIVMISEHIGTGGINIINMLGIYSLGDMFTNNTYTANSSFVMLGLSAVLLVFSSVCVKPINKFSLSGKKRSAIRKGPKREVE